MLSIIIALLIFGFLILVHEFGHYITARIFKVGIKEFSIGMGPKLVQKKSAKTGISYTVRLLPIGGYVSMDGEDEDSASENAFNNKPKWQRFIVLVAGAVMNILCGVILTSILVVMLRSSLGNTTVSKLSENASLLDNGLKIGDKIVSVNGERVSTSYDLQYTIYRDGKDKNTVKVLRDGEEITLDGVEFYESYTKDGKEYSRYTFGVQREVFGFATFIKHTVNRSLTTVEMIWESVIDLISGKYGLEQLSGPVGITSEIGNAVNAKDGGMSLISLSAVIALNLGVMNLLPLPALDGGRIIFLVIEAIARKPVKREIEGYINFIGLALLMLLMLIVTFQDITRLFG